MQAPDYSFMCAELKEQFSCMSGRLLSLIEELGLPDKQEQAAKRHLKSEVWQRYNDFVKCMWDFKRGGFTGEAPNGGIPLDEDE